MNFNDYDDDDATGEGACVSYTSSSSTSSFSSSTHTAFPLARADAESVPAVATLLSELPSDVAYMVDVPMVRITVAVLLTIVVVIRSFMLKETFRYVKLIIAFGVMLLAANVFITGSRDIVEHHALERLPTESPSIVHVRLKGSESGRGYESHMAMNGLRALVGNMLDVFPRDTRAAKSFMRTTLLERSVGGIWLDYGPIHENLPDKFILIMNHRSTMDYHMAFTVIPQNHRLLIPIGETRIWVVAPLFSHLFGCQVLDKNTRDEKARQHRRDFLQESINEINAADKMGMVVFPEGRLNHVDFSKLNPFYRGAFVISYETQVPVLALLRHDHLRPEDFMRGKTRVVDRVEGTFTGLYYPPPKCPGPSAVYRGANPASDERIEKFKNFVWSEMQECMNLQVKQLGI